MKISIDYENGEKDTFFVLGIDLNNKKFFIYHIHVPSLMWIDDKGFDICIDDNLIIPSYLTEDDKGVFLPTGLHKRNLELVLFNPNDRFDFDSSNNEIWTKSKYLKIIDNFGIKIYEPHRKYIDKYSVSLSIQTYLELLIDTLEYNPKRIHHNYIASIWHKNQDDTLLIENSENWNEILENSINILFQRWSDSTYTNFSHNVVHTLKRKLYLLIAALIVDEGTISITNNLKDFYELNLVIQTEKYSYSIQVEYVLP